LRLREGTYGNGGTEKAATTPESSEGEPTKKKKKEEGRAIGKRRPISTGDRARNLATQEKTVKGRIQHEGLSVG